MSRMISGTPYVEDGILGRFAILPSLGVLLNCRWSLPTHREICLSSKLDGRNESSTSCAGATCIVCSSNFVHLYAIVRFQLLPGRISIMTYPGICVLAYGWILKREQGEFIYQPGLGETADWSTLQRSLGDRNQRSAKNPSSMIARCTSVGQFSWSANQVAAH